MLTADFVSTLYVQPAVKQELIDIYMKGLKEVWQVLISFAVIAVPIAVVIKEAPLRTELFTEFGLTGDEKEDMKLAQVSGRETVNENGLRSIHSRSSRFVTTLYFRSSSLSIISKIVLIVISSLAYISSSYPGR